MNKIIINIIIYLEDFKKNKQRVQGPIQKWKDQYKKVLIENAQTHTKISEYFNFENFIFNVSMSV